MLELPARRLLAELADSATNIIPTVAVGFVRALDDGDASILYSHPYGIRGYRVSASELPDARAPQPGAVRQ